jgi:hypothetical protein
MFKFGEQAITHDRGCHGDSNQEPTLQRYKSDNTTHAGPEAPRVTTIHDVTKKLGQVLPCPSAVFHAYASADTPWVA